ncbi:MAG: hypothetical protein MUO24_10970 [Desulfobacterales bacterium]|nr:hypothetical protein [Desulfobacterales bacterium]
MGAKADSDLVLTWGKVLLLAPIAALGAVVGQLVFDVTNALTGGLVSGFLTNILIKPIVPYFWPAFDTSIFLFRWALGAGGIGLSFALALRFSPEKAVGTSLIGCAAGLIGWLLTSCVADKIPILIPFIFRIVLPPTFIFLILGITLSDLRKITLKLMFGAALGAIVGTILVALLVMLSLGTTMQLLSALSQAGLASINPIRLIDAIFVMLSINLICLSLLKKRLQKSVRVLHKEKE